MLLSAAIDEFLTIHAKNLAKETQRRYTWELERFSTYCGGINSDDLRAITVARYLDSLRTHPDRRGHMLSSRTLRAYAKSLRVLVRWLVTEDLTSEKALRFEIPRGESRVPSTLTADQALALVRACQESRGRAVQARDTALLLLMLETGLRVSEACNLRLSDVRLDGDPHVLIRYGKGAKWREVGPLGKRTVRALRSYATTWRPRLASMCQGARGEDRFFLGRSGGPLVPGVVGKLLERLEKRTGIAAHPHTLRHTWARQRALAGTDTLVISRLMGHTSLQTTALYLGQFASADARQQVGSLVDSL